MAVKLKQEIEIKLGGRVRPPILKLPTLKLFNIALLGNSCKIDFRINLKPFDILKFSNFWISYTLLFGIYLSDIQELQDSSRRF